MNTGAWNNRRVRWTAGMALAWVIAVSGFAPTRPAFAGETNKPAAPSSPWTSGFRRLTDGRGLVATVMDPAASDRPVRGGRFCPMAVVAQATLDGTEFFNTPPPGDETLGWPGTVAEFSGAVGYDETPPDGTFVKVGVGVLRKRGGADAGKKYLFYQDYDLVAAAPIRVVWGADRVVFRQTLDPALAGGYGYELEASVRVAGPRLHVDWRLENRGEKPIATRHYHHNSFRFGAEPVGAGYTLSCPGEATALEWLAGGGRPLALPDFAFTERRNLRLLATPARPVNLRLDFADGARTALPLLLARDNGPAVRFRTEPAPQSRLEVHIRAEHFCPEQILAIDVSPGESFSWRRGYEFHPRGYSVSAQDAP